MFTAGKGVSVMNAGERKTIYFDQTHNIYGAFVNESPHGVRIGQVTWPTVRHYLLGEEFPEAVQAGLRLTSSVEEALQLIGGQTFVRRHKWEAQRDDYLCRALIAKFTQHLELEHLLAGTGSAELVYANREDWYDGIGAKAVGYNMLGRLLTRVRGKLTRLRLDFLFGEGTAARFEKAESLAETNSSDAHALSNLAGWYLLIGEPERALMVARRALAISRDNEEWNLCVLAQALGALGRHQEAIEPTKRLVKLDPQDPNYLKWLAHSLISIGKEIPAKVYAHRARVLQRKNNPPAEDETDE